MKINFATNSMVGLTHNLPVTAGASPRPTTVGSAYALSLHESGAVRKFAKGKTWLPIKILKFPLDLLVRIKYSYFVERKK